MQSVFVSRVSHASNDPRPPIARAESPVTYDPRAVAAKVSIMSTLTDRIDAYTMHGHTTSLRPFPGRFFFAAEGMSTPEWTLCPHCLAARSSDGSWDNTADAQRPA